MPRAWIPPRGGLEKKVVFSPCCGDETTTYYDGAYENTVSFSSFSVGGLHDRDFLWVISLELQKIKCQTLAVPQPCS